MQYIDMHCDTLAKALAERSATAERLDGTMADIARLRKAGAKAQFFAVFLPQRRMPEWFGLEEMPEPEALFDSMYEIYRNTLRACGGTLAPAGSWEELSRNAREGKLSAVLTMENGAPVRGELSRIKAYYDLGVRLITLTWNDANCFGYPHSAVPEEMGRGLTEFGREAVAYMEELGMLVDVSHLSDGGFWDVAACARRAAKPFVASHSNCRALAPATRNLTDRMIRELAECGGVAGLNFAPAFLNGDPCDPQSRIARMCDHVEHMVQAGGIACAGIGTDFDGIEGEFEIADCTGIPRLFDALHMRGFSWDAVEQIAHGNVERVLREAL